MKTVKNKKSQPLDIITKLQILAITVGLITFPTCLKDTPTPPHNGNTANFQVDLTPVAKLPSILYESSGLVIASPNKLWSHNDSGNENKLYCFNSSGNLLRSLTISNATNVDWEDLALDNEKRIYICDTGNNDNNRKNLCIYRIPNPDTHTENSIAADIITFSFEDQIEFPPPISNRNFDVEAVIWHNDSLFMFTKDRSLPLTGYTKMYKISAEPGNRTATLAGSIYLGNTNSSARVTAADFHQKSNSLVLLVQERLIVFTNFEGSNFLDGIPTSFTFNQMPGQAEAIFFNDESTLAITEEGANGSPGWLYQVLLPAFQDK